MFCRYFKTVFCYFCISTRQREIENSVCSLFTISDVIIIRNNKSIIALE